MSVIRLAPQPLTAAAFAPFGDVIEAGRDYELINRGTTRQFADLARIEYDPAGRPRVSLYRASPYELPLELRMLERHPLGSQLFMPLRGERFLVVVAPRGETIEPSAVRAFVTDGRQGVNYHRGSWHHPVIALHDPTEFLILDRGGPGQNCEEFHFADDRPLLQPPR